MGGGGEGRDGGVRVDVKGRIEVFVKNFKKMNIFFFVGGGGSGGGVWVDMIEELKFFGIHKKGVGWGEGGSGWWGRVRVDVNEELKFL